MFPECVITGIKKGEKKKVGFNFSNSSGVAVDMSSGVTFTAKLYNPDLLLATYTNTDVDKTNAATGQIGVLCDFICPGIWKCALTSTWTSPAKIHIAIATIHVEDEDAPSAWTSSTVEYLPCFSCDGEML